MATFALIHGAFHGAWCWDLLAKELRERGHSVTAVDLPDEPTAGVEVYADTVIAALTASDYADPVVVAHSLGGLTGAVVAERVPVRLLVLLGAMIPQPGRSMFEVMAETGAAHADVRPVLHDDGTSSVSASDATRIFYHDCPPELTAQALSRLRRQSWIVATEACPLSTWPRVPTRYLLCDDDRSVDPDWSRRAARDLLGVVPDEMPGGHSPFLARPIELADRLESYLE